MSITWVPKRMQVQTSMEIFKATGRHPFLGCACGRLEPLPRRFLGKSRRALAHVHLLWPVRFPQMLCPPGAWQRASHSGLPGQVPGYGTLTGEGRSFASAKQKRPNVKERAASAVSRVCGSRWCDRAHCSAEAATEKVCRLSWRRWWNVPSSQRGSLRQGSPLDPWGNFTWCGLDLKDFIYDQALGFSLLQAAASKPISGRETDQILLDDLGKFSFRSPFFLNKILNFLEACI